MPDTDLTARDLLDNAVRLGLITQSQANAVLVDAPDGSLKSVESLLSRRNLLTSWQLDRLRKGDSQGFFYGGHRVLFHIAEGTFARVYRGVRQPGNQPIAIKVLRQRFVADRGAIERFRKEAEAGLKLIHPNIVQVYDYGEEQGRHYMTMEFVEGANLREFLRRRVRLPYQEALPMMIGLAQGLKYSLEQGVTHRDLKATNILISTNRQAKLVDFGLAEIEDEKKVERTHSQRTVDYSALERTCGSPKGDPRSDIFFLGCVYYQMLTGQAPMSEVESDDPIRKMMKRSFGAITPISEHRHAPPPELAAIIEKMMKVDLKQRYQSMAEVLADLEAFAARIGGTAPVETRTSKPSRTGGDFEDFDFDNLRPDQIFLPPGSNIPSDPEPELQPQPGGLTSASPMFPRSSTTEPSHSDAGSTGSFDIEDQSALQDEPGMDQGPSLFDDDDDQDGPTHEEDPSSAGGEFVAFVQPELFCVERQEEVREVFRKSFDKRGLRVFLFSDLDLAMERYREHPTDFILFDADGFGSGAIESFRKLRNLAKQLGRKPRIVLLLGPKQAPLRSSIPENDRLVVLVKPLKMKEITQAVEDQLARSGQSLSS